MESNVNSCSSAASDDSGGVGSCDIEASSFWNSGDGGMAGAGGLPFEDAIVEFPELPRLVHAATGLHIIFFGSVSTLTILE